jgi:hypothetical protein
VDATNASLVLRYRLVLGLFVVALIISGATALPLQWELSIVDGIFGGAVGAWIHHVREAIDQTYARFPFFGYATDWLAFGHFVIAGFLVLPLLNPAKYRGVLQIGLAACTGVIAIALICGPIRQIPVFWRMIDCSFGVVGAVPLLYCLWLTRKIDNRES